MSEFPKRLKIEVLFDVGEIVYINTDSEQSKHIVMSYMVNERGVAYDLYSHSSGSYIAWDFEISREKDIT